MFPVVKTGLISHLGGKESALSLTIVCSESKAPFNSD